MDSFEILTSSSWDWLKPLVGTIVGFSLGLIPGWFKRVRDKKEIGKIFDQQLQSFMEPIKQQIHSIDEFVKAIKNNEFKAVHVLQRSKFDLIKSLDPLTLIKHLEQKGVESPANCLNSINYNLDLLVELTDNVRTSSNQFEADSVKFIKEYKTHYDNLTRLVAKEMRIVETKDPLISTFVNLVDKHIGDKPFEISLILSIRKTFNEELFKFPFDIPKHPLHDSFNNFNYAAVDLVTHYEVTKLLHINKMVQYSNSMKFIYNELYKKEMLN